LTRFWIWTPIAQLIAATMPISAPTGLAPMAAKS